MINMKKIVVLLSAIAVTAGFASAAKEEGGKADATLRLSFKSVAVGLGFSSGSGTLTYKGKDYPVAVKGFAVGKVGVTSASATGQVYNLKDLKDFDGHYDVSGAGMRGVTAGAGRKTTTMRNQAGVIVAVASTQKGVDVNATGGGVDMKIQR